MSLIASKGNDVKYVTVELLMKDAIETAQVWQDQKDKVIFGLLKGVEKKIVAAGSGEEVFTLVSLPDKSTKLCNLDVFNILSLEVYDGVERDITFFRSSNEDQNSALQMVEEIVLILTEAKRMVGDSELIDVSTFTELPKDFSTSKAASPSTQTGMVKSYNQPATHHHGHATTHTPSYTHTSYTKEKEPTIFKRTSRKPTKAALDKMREAVLAIQAGKYEPKIPIIKDDDKEDDDKEAHTSKTYPYDDEDYGYCC
jgi:hypothetical protein